MQEPITMKEPGESKKDAVLRVALARMNEAYTAEEPHRERAEDDLRNVIGEQCMNLPDDRDA